MSDKTFKVVRDGEVLGVTSDVEWTEHRLGPYRGLQECQGQVSRLLLNGSAEIVHGAPVDLEGDDCVFRGVVILSWKRSFATEPPLEPFTVLEDVSFQYRKREMMGPDVWWRDGDVLYQGPKATYTHRVWVEKKALVVRDGREHEARIPVKEVQVLLNRAFGDLARLWGEAPDLRGLTDSWDE